MKALQLKISLTKKKKRISRVLLVSKTETFDNLHGMIQILFNLDSTEMYTFEINKKLISRSSTNSHLKTLNRLKENDVFYYHYDLIDSLHFKIEVLESVTTETAPLCIKANGKNLYEGVEEQLEEKYQSNVDIKWINQCLSYYREDVRYTFMNDVKKEIVRLTHIKYFQDYMHNQIVKIVCPQDKIIYMGCDATSDVVLNYHVNSNKLIEYTGINPSAGSQSILKYHDCIECTLMRKNSLDDDIEFDFKVGNFGVFVSHANVFTNEDIPVEYMNQYLYALRKYVDVIEYAKLNNIKYKLGYMIESKDNEINQVIGRMNIYNIEFLGEELCKELTKQYPLVDDYVEIDVLTFHKYEHKLETKVIVGNKNNYLESVVYNGSLKTLLVEILVLLQARWEKSGMDKTWILRDNHLVNEFKKISKYLGVEIVLQDQLDGIDEKYLINSKNMEVDDLDPSQMVIKLMEELGLDTKNLHQVELSKEELIEKIQSIRNQKKYS